MIRYQRALANCCAECGKYPFTDMSQPRSVLDCLARGFGLERDFHDAVALFFAAGQLPVN